MPREFNRSDRVAGQLRRDLARLIQMEIKDPDVGFVSLSDVEVTRDLAHAKVYITVFEPEKAVTSLRALKRAAAFLRRRLGQELRMRQVPELHFLHDDSVERGSHIDSLIERALDSDRGAGDEDRDSEE
jgi:ribosome-binding factor A